MSAEASRIQQVAQGWTEKLYTVLLVAALLIIAIAAADHLQSASVGQPQNSQVLSTNSDTARSSSTPAVEQTPLTSSQCPAWFTQYESFHAATRGKPGSRYLIHQVPDYSVGGSGGFGDRIRGMMFALRLAAAHKRVLLFTWARPVELEHLLVPSGSINWTLGGIPEYNNNQAQAALVLRFMNGAHHPMVLNGSLAIATQQFVIVQTNQIMDAECPGCPALPPMDVSTACIWARLFKPSEEIVLAAEQEMVQLFSSSSPQFVAVHLRLGGFTGEGEHERGKGPLKNFAGAVRCAHQLAREHNISSSTPILMVTDNQHLRSFLREGHLPNVVAPHTDAVHIDQARALDNNVTAHRSTIVDLLLLSRGTCLVTSPGYRHGGLSGFSHQGWLLGGAKPCRIDFRRCI